MGLRIVVVGADYDRSYFDHYVAPADFGDRFDAIGRWPIGDTLAVVQRARFVVAYQSGIGIVCPFFGVPAAMFWRPYGDSLHPQFFISFREEMASAWVPPNSTAYMPLIYGNCSPESIASFARDAGWHCRVQ
jgi:hypothetical protein